MRQIDAEVLGKLLVIQQTLDMMPNAEGIAAFLGRALREVPGVDRIHLCIDGTLYPPDPAIAEACIAEDAGSARRLDALSGRPDLLILPLRTPRKGFGGLIVILNDAAAFEPYRDFIGNIANTLSSHLETREHLRLLDDTNARLSRARDDLENRVEMRTAELRSINDALYREVEEKMAAVEALKKSHEEIHQIIESSPVPMALTDKAQQIVYLNRAFTEVFGYTAADLPSVEEWWPRAYPDPRQREEVENLWNRRVARSMQSGHPMEPMEATVTCKNGETRDIVFHFSFIGSRGLTLFHDISERKRNEKLLTRLTADLLKSNKDLNQFAYVASHDLREPLRTVANYLQLIQRRYGPTLDKDANEFLAFALDGAQRMQTYMEDLLSYSRVSSRAKPPAMVDAGRCLEYALQNLQAEIGETNARITRGQLPVLPADAAQLTQAFQNLLGNALKFRRGDVAPAIAITAEEKGGAWEFHVADNGIGIEPRHHERIFEMFQRLHTQQEFPGSGMGLAIVKKIVERHGGAIGVVSAPGGGATFSFTIPKKAMAETHG